jgi:hypothetical protein
VGSGDGRWYASVAELNGAMRGQGAISVSPAGDGRVRFYHRISPTYQGQHGESLAIRRDGGWWSDDIWLLVGSGADEGQPLLSVVQRVDLAVAWFDWSQEGMSCGLAGCARCEELWSEVVRVSRRLEEV